MKKIALGLVIVSVLFLSGCTLLGSGKYKEGTYFGSKVYESQGKQYVATAVIYVSDNGKIATVFIDSTYTTKDGVATTKKVLGDAYGMKATSASIGVIAGGAEWFEQIKVLEDKIVSEQGLEWLKYSDATNTKTDSVSGVTISVNDYYAAVKIALDQAK